MSWYDIERLFDSNREHQIMLIKTCWMTALEIQERMSRFKKETSGKESYTVAEETDKAWPFPKYRPNNESDNDES